MLACCSGPLQYHNIGVIDAGILYWTSARYSPSMFMACSMYVIDIKFKGFDLSPGNCFLIVVFV